MTEKQLQEQIKDWKLSMWNASQANYAKGVMNAKRELDKLYRQLDQLHRGR